MKNKVTVRDIARDLNISVSTVSFVLNGKGREYRISPAVEERVLTHAQELGYRKKPLAGRRPAVKTHTIALLVEDIADPFYSAFVAAAEQMAFQKGYAVLVSSTRNKREKACHLIEKYRCLQVDGYLIASAAGIEQEIHSLLREEVPLVMFYHYCPGIPAVNVAVDNQKGVYEAAVHLAFHGCKNIALAVMDSDPYVAGRVNSYCNGIQQFQLEEFVLRIPFGLKEKETEVVLHSFLEYRQQVDAVIFASSALSVPGLKALYRLEAGRRGKIRTAVFDSHSFFETLPPAAIAVEQPVPQLVKKSVGALLALMEDRPEVQLDKTIWVKPTLLVRPAAEGGQGTIRRLSEWLPGNFNQAFLNKK